MTDRTESDRICNKWRLIGELIGRRNLIHGDVIQTWKRWRDRTAAQQQEIDTVIALARHHLTECDRLETEAKNQ